MKAGAERTVYAAYLGTTAAAVYTFTGTTGSLCRVLRMRFTNTHTVAVVLNVSIVPSGGTLSDVTYAELSLIPLAVAGADESMAEYEPDSPGAGIKLRAGESIVAWSDTNNKVAARIEVEDVV